MARFLAVSLLVALFELTLAQVPDGPGRVRVPRGSATIKANLLQCTCSPTDRGYSQHVFRFVSKGNSAAIRIADSLLARGPNRNPGQARQDAQESRTNTFENCINMYGAEACVNADAALRTITGDQYCAYDFQTGKNVRVDGNSNFLISVGPCNARNAGEGYPSSPLDRGRGTSAAGRPVGGAQEASGQIADYPGRVSGSRSAPGIGTSPTPSPSKKPPAPQPPQSGQKPPSGNGGPSGSGASRAKPTVTPAVPKPGSGSGSPGSGNGSDNGSSGSSSGGSTNTPSGSDNGSSGGDSSDPSSSFVPSAETLNEGCVAIEHLKGYVMQHGSHLRRRVLCSRGFCATPNHAIIVGGQYTSMRRLCSSKWECTPDVKLVNNLKIARNTRAVFEDIIITPYDIRFPIFAVWALQIAEDVLHIVIASLALSAAAAIGLMTYAKTCVPTDKVFENTDIVKKTVVTRRCRFVDRPVSLVPAPQAIRC